LWYTKVTIGGALILTKLKMKKPIKYILIVLLVVLLLGSIPVGMHFYTKHKLLDLNYSIDAVQEIMKKKKTDYVYKVGYNQVLERAFTSSAYQEKYLDHYLKIEFQDQKNLISSINTLLDKGYKEDEISLILARGNDETVSEFLKKDYVDDIKDYMQYDFAKLENYDRYVAYQMKERENEEDTVTFVEIGLDREFYEGYTEISDFSETVLANKYHKLTEDYVPDDLMKIKEEFAVDRKQMVSKVACVAFEKMAEDALKEDMHILANSSYRSYQEQEEIYNEYKDLYGLNYAESYAARPGFSEHQTGLVIDVKSRDSRIFADSKEFTWMKEHAYEYGFIMRYPKDKEYITGYKYEAWHYRYVGEELAKKVYESGLTYDEYYIRYLAK